MSKSDTTKQILRHSYERAGLSPEGDSPGQRFVNSAYYNEDGGRFDSPRKGHVPRVLTASEFAGRVRSLAIPERNALDTPAQAPTPQAARLPGLVDLLVVEESTVPVASENVATLGAGGIPEDQSASYGELDVTFEGERFSLQRWGVGAQLPLDLLEVSAVAEAAIDRLADVALMRALENDFINGDGSTTTSTVHFTGINNTSGTGSYTRDTAGGEPRVVALAEGVRLVQASGFYDQPLTITAHPDTLKAIRTEDRSTPIADVLADVEAFIPSLAVAAGEAVVGDWHNGAVLILRDGFSLDMSADHADAFLKDWVAAVLRTQAQFWVRYPSAFAIVDSL